MAAIGEIVPVLPVPLVASVFMHDPRRSMSELELKAAVLALIERVEALGAHVYVSRTDRDYASTVGLCMLTLRHLAREHDGLFTSNPDELKVLAHYANSIAHLGRTPTVTRQENKAPPGPCRFSAALNPCSARFSKRPVNRCRPRGPGSTGATGTRCTGSGTRPAWR